MPEIVIVVEFKDYRIGGPTMDQIVGSAMRARFRNRPAELLDVIVFCRGFTLEAMQRASELEAELNVTIAFKVVP